MKLIKPHDQDSAEECGYFTCDELNQSDIENGLNEKRCGKKGINGDEPHWVAAARQARISTDSVGKTVSDYPAPPCLRLNQKYSNLLKTPSKDDYGDVQVLEQTSELKLSGPCKNFSLEDALKVASSFRQPGFTNEEKSLIEYKTSDKITSSKTKLNKTIKSHLTKQQDISHIIENSNTFPPIISSGRFSPLESNNDINHSGRQSNFESALLTVRDMVHVKPKRKKERIFLENNFVVSQTRKIMSPKLDDSKPSETLQHHSSNRTISRLTRSKSGVSNIVKKSNDLKHHHKKISPNQTVRASSRESSVGQTVDTTFEKNQKRSKSLSSSIKKQVFDKKQVSTPSDTFQELLPSDAEIKTSEASDIVVSKQHVLRKKKVKCKKVQNDTEHILKSRIPTKGHTRNWRMSQYIKHMMIETTKPDLLAKECMVLLNNTTAYTSSMSSMKDKPNSELQANTTDAKVSPYITHLDIKRHDNKKSYHHTPKSHSRIQDCHIFSTPNQSSSSSTTKRQSSIPSWVMSPSQIEMLSQLHTGLTPRQSLTTSSLKNDSYVSPCITIIQESTACSEDSDNDPESEYTKKYASDILGTVQERSFQNQQLIERHKKKFATLWLPKTKQTKSFNTTVFKTNQYETNDEIRQFFLEKEHETKRSRDAETMETITWVAEHGSSNVERDDALEELNYLEYNDDDDVFSTQHCSI